MNVINTLKQEIDRLAASQAKAQVAKVHRTAMEYRHEVAALKRLLHEKEREIARLKKSQQTPIDDDPLAGVRFSPRSVRSQRQRLGLTAEEYGSLVGVSALSVLAWEQGKSRPRRKPFLALVAIRGISKKTALAKLADLEATAKKRR